MIGGYGLTFRQKVKLWRDTESAKLRTMTFGGKIGYIFTYYWKWMLLTLVVLMFCGYVGDAIVQAHKETVLEGFFTNDDYNLFPAGELEREFAAVLELGKGQRVIFDDSLYIGLDGIAREYSAASNGKIIAYMATQELDFVVTTETVYSYYAEDVPMADLETVLSPELFAALEDYLVEGTDPDGKACFTGVDMSQSRYVAGRDKADAGAERYIMFVPYNAPHIEMLNTYLGYCFASITGAEPLRPGLDA